MNPITYQPLRHASPFYTASASYPTLYRYLPYGPFNTLEDFLAWHRVRIEEDMGTFLFVVIDKSAVRPPVNALNPNSSAESYQHPDSSDGNHNADAHSIAGLIAYLNTNSQHATTEIGHIIVLPRFQGTHVVRHAIGLLLKYALSLPKDRDSGGVSEHNSISGLGLRRVQYQANALNTRSVRVAERMGFLREGLIRWQRVLPPEKEGKTGRDGEHAWCGSEGGGWGPARDTMMLAICCDDWESGVKERVDQVMSGYP